MLTSAGQRRLRRGQPPGERTAISATLSAFAPASPGTRHTHTPSSVARATPTFSRPTPYWWTRPKPPAASRQHGGIDRGTKKAHRVDSVQVVGHLPWRAGRDLPAGEQRREIAPGQLGGKTLAAEKDPAQCGR